MGQTSAAVDDPAEGSSNALVDLTPAKFACSISISCPAILKDESAGTYIVIGKIRDPQSPGLRGRVGMGEMAVEISSELVETAIQSSPLRKLATLPFSLIQLTTRRLKFF